MPPNLNQLMHFFNDLLASKYVQKVGFNQSSSDKALLAPPGNPWSCDCELHHVFSKILFVRHLHIDDYSNVTCRYPPQLAGALLTWVDSQLCIAETATVLVITVTVLVTVVAAVVMAERNRKRNRGKKWDSETQAQT